MMPEKQVWGEPLVCGFENGHKQVWMAAEGRVCICRYEGAFKTTALQAKADTGLYFASLRGSHVKIEGEGDTQDLALQDLKNRLCEEAMHCFEMSAACPGRRRLKRTRSSTISGSSSSTRCTRRRCSKGSGRSRDSLARFLRPCPRCRLASPSFHQVPSDLELPETTRALIFVKMRRDNHGAALVTFVALQELGLLDAYLGRTADSTPAPATDDIPP